MVRGHGGHGHEHGHAGAQGHGQGDGHDHRGGDGHGHGLWAMGHLATNHWLAMVMATVLPIKPSGKRSSVSACFLSFVFKIVLDKMWVLI